MLSYRNFLCAAIMLAFIVGCGGEVAKETMFDAAEKGDTETVYEGIQNGFDVNAQDANGDTMVHHAVRGGQVDMIAALIEMHSASPVVRNKENKTPMDVAAELNNEEVMEVLASSGG